MEIIGSALEGSEVLHNGYLSLERAQKELVSGSYDEDYSNDKSDLVDAIPEVEISGNDLVGPEELNDGNQLPEGTEKKLSAGSDGKDANTDKLALAGTNLEVETSGSDSEGTEELHNGSMSLKDTEGELVSRLDGEYVNSEKSSRVGGIHEVEFSGRNIAEVNGGKLLLERAENELMTLALGGHDPSNEKSVLVCAKSEVNITVSASSTKRSNTQNFVSEKRSILPVSPGKIEEGASGNHVSFNKQQKESQKNIQKSFDRVRSVDVIDSSKPSAIPGGLYKSQATRRYYGYDGKDERFPIQPLDSSENTYKAANSVYEGRSRNGKGHVNSISYGDHGTRHQPYFPNEKHHVVKDSRRNQKKVQKSTTQHGHQHWMRAKRDKFPSRIPFHRSGFQSRYESCSPSNQMDDETVSREDKNQEKMKLFRMIHKLQDQLNRTRSTSKETNRRLSTCVSYKGNHIPAYHSHDLHEGRFYHGRDYPIPTRNGRCSHGVNLNQRHKFSRLPYSSEETRSAHHADHSCFDCCRHKQNFSADLLQHEELYRSYPGHDCCSSNSTPQRFKTSQFLVFGLLGGAPFVTCHKCLNLLHLPADFLLFERACHQIKCGECSEILKFSMQNRNHIASYSPSGMGSPSGDFDDKKEVINNSSNLPSEEEPLSLAQIHPLHESEYNTFKVEPSTEREKISSRHSSTSKAPVRADQSAEISSNITVSWKLSSEKEAKQPPKSSPLHKLMGYASPSQVIRGTTSL
ncbi:putative zinc-ribbon domain, plant protein [Lupinus albus]|uniref:Putative zinc-ribbon domain, plant protein n=1 Tax=Lupinus albus TaxID=3870 RepID=A0A6A4PS62_LUPAL|nr:putative zinc-ribbon domain, plant protein [Lupinus albus]